MQVPSGRLIKREGRGAVSDVDNMNAWGPWVDEVQTTTDQSSSSDFCLFSIFIRALDGDKCEESDVVDVKLPCDAAA